MLSMQLNPASDLLILKNGEKCSLAEIPVYDSTSLFIQKLKNDLLWISVKHRLTTLSNKHVS